MVKIKRQLAEFLQSDEPATPTNNLKQVGLAMANYDGSAEQGTAKTQSPSIPRKIIYDAKIDLVVESLNGLEPSILDLVKRNGGFLAESDLATQVEHPAHGDLAGARAGRPFRRLRRPGQPAGRGAAPATSGPRT